MPSATHRSIYIVAIYSYHKIMEYGSSPYSTLTNPVAGFEVSKSIIHLVVGA